MSKLCLITILLLAANFGFTQNDTLQLLKGDWFSFGTTPPDVNDTFGLSREKTCDSYIKWEFRENGSFYAQGIAEVAGANNPETSVIIMDSFVLSIWVYNKEQKTFELKDLSMTFKITEINKDYLEVLRLN